MKKIMFLTGLFLVVLFSGFAQISTFSKLIYSPSRNIGLSIENDRGNGVFFVGNYNFQAYDEHGMLVHIDSAGDLISSWRLADTTSLVCIKATNDSCFIITGTIGNRVLVIKTNAVGDTLWTKQISYPAFAASTPHDIIQCADSSYIISGYHLYTTPTSYYHSSFLTKLSSSGVLIWHKDLYSGLGSYAIRTIKETTDSGYVLMEAMVDSMSQTSTGLVRLDKNGNSMWSKKYFFPAFMSGCLDMDVTSNGILFNYIASDTTGAHLGFLKTDLNGNILWQKSTGETSYFGSGPVRIFGRMTRCSDGGYVSLNGMDQLDYYSNMNKIDSSGNLLWTEYLDCNALSITEAKDTGLVILGSGPVYGRSGGNYSAILKTDNNGGGTSCTSSYSYTSSPDNLNVGPHTISFTSSLALVSSSPLTMVGISLSETSSCAGLIGINENSKPHISVYPNPSNGHVTFSNLEKGSIIEIIDILGRTVCDIISKESTLIINLDNQPQGIYLYRICSNSKVLQQGKLCIN